MKNIIITIIIFIITVSLGYAIFDSVRDYWENIKVEEWARKIACEDLSYKTQYNYKKYIDKNEDVDIKKFEEEWIEKIKQINNLAIEIEAQAEGWKFISQTEECAMQKSNNLAVPFLSTIEYIFQDPQNNNVYHFLTKSYIYDGFYSEWAPLSSNLSEFNENITASIRYKDLGRWRLWQGD